MIRFKTGFKTGMMVAVALAFVFAGACARKTEYPKAPAYNPHPSGDMPIVASGAFSPPYINDQQFQWMKEAGFNTIAQNLRPSDVDSCLKYARKYDIEVMAKPYGISDTANCVAIAKRFGDQPKVWGFTVVDEPKASQFPYLKRLQELITSVAPNQNCYFNLLPAIGAKGLGAKDYRTYVEDYVKTVNPPYISLDIYPVKERKDGSIYVHPILYQTMEVIRDVARESDRPFWAYVLCNKHLDFPKPREEFIRFQAFTFLAYGAQGLKYYTYMMPDFDKETRDYSDGPINWEGKRTPVWSMVRNVNREVKNLEKVFLGADVLSVTQTGAQIPEATERCYRLPAPFRGIESFGEGVMVSHLRNGNDEYLVLVNRDVLSKQKVRLTRTRPVTRLYGDGSEKADSGSSLTLDPGGYAIFRL